MTHTLKKQGVFFSAALVAATLIALPECADAKDRGGGSRGSARSSVSRGGGGMHSAGAARSPSSRNPTATHRDTRNVNIDNSNRNVNIDNSKNIDVNVDNHGRRNGCCYYHDNHHPVATAVGVTAAVAITAAAIGTVVYALPPDCMTVVRANIAYRICGDTWYEPRYAGSSVSYVVITAP